MDDKSDMTYWTNSEIFGIMKSPIHTTYKLKEEFMSRENDDQNIKMRYQAT